MKVQLQQNISATVVKLLRPLVRILLRNGIPYDAFADLAKRMYIDVASKEFRIPGRKQSDSRVAIITGLNRKEIRRVRSLPLLDDAGAAERYNRAARVISGWIRDPRYAGTKREPALLPIEGEDATFGELVKRYSGDVPARAILDELTRVGAVELTEDGRVRLLERSYIPRTGELDKIGILGTDVSELIATIDHNLRFGASDPFFQRKVSYDNLPAEAIPEVRKLTRARGQELLEFLDGEISRHDRDINPDVGGTGRRYAGVGIFYFEDEETEESHEE
jgi:hypothetical protein